MNKEEITEWFWNKFDSCYPVKCDDYPNRIFWLHDEKVIRKIKLLKLNNEKIDFEVKFKYNCLFEQNIEFNYFYNDYIEIWSFLEDNYINNYRSVQSIIKDIISDDYNLKPYTPFIKKGICKNILYDKRIKLNVCTPLLSYNHKDIKS